MTRAKEAEPIQLAAHWPSDVPRAAELGKALAMTLGFSEAHADAIALVVTELATNLIRHASGGTVRISAVSEGDRHGIEVGTVDNGPGIPDVERAITDGYSTAGGLGLGLGAVNRLMDELVINDGTNGGTVILCRRWHRASANSPTGGGVSFGAATRSYHRLPENGDTFVIKQWDRCALAGVIDGLGHGQLAQRAAQTARQYIETHFDQPLDHLFHGTGRACRATRGVVMALARFDLERQKVTVASVGNIEVRLIGSPQRFNLIVRRGIVGLNAPDPILTEQPWTKQTILVMHSDGVHPHWDWTQFAEVKDATPALIATQLLGKLGKIDDDATVVVARSAAQ